MQHIEKSLRQTEAHFVFSYLSSFLQHFLYKTKIFKTPVLTQDLIPQENCHNFSFFFSNSKCELDCLEVAAAPMKGSLSTIGREIK